MAIPNPKNAALSPAGVDLGLGNTLNQDLLDQEEERKKRLKNGTGDMGAASTALLGPGLFNG